MEHECYCNLHLAAYMVQKYTFCKKNQTKTSPEKKITGNKTLDNKYSGVSLILPQSLEVQQGAVLALGHLMGRWCRVGRHGDLQVEEMEHDGEAMDDGDSMKDCGSALLLCVKRLCEFV